MIKLNSDEIAILGRPNFTCGNIGRRLHEIGLYEVANKAEDEQAATIHFLMDMYKKHGDNWLEEANNILRNERG